MDGISLLSRVISMLIKFAYFYEMMVQENNNKILIDQLYEYNVLIDTLSILLATYDEKTEVDIVRISSLVRGVLQPFLSGPRAVT